jgi:hypothetical protein
VLLVGSAWGAGHSGKLSGVLTVSGAKHGPQRESGIVVVTSRAGKRHRIIVGRSGRFSIRLPAGRYHAIGGIPQLGWTLGSCLVEAPPAPAWVEVFAGRTTRVMIDCAGH